MIDLDPSTPLIQSPQVTEAYVRCRRQSRTRAPAARPD
jgi:hypothetical protein